MRKRILSLVLAAALAFPSTGITIYANGNESDTHTQSVTVDGSTVIVTDSPSGEHSHDTETHGNKEETSKEDSSQEDDSQEDISQEESSTEDTSEESTSKEEMSNTDSSSVDVSTSQTTDSSEDSADGEQQESMPQDIDDTDRKEESKEQTLEEALKEHEELYAEQGFTTVYEPLVDYQTFAQQNRANVTITTPNNWVKEVAYDGVDLYPDGTFVGNGTTELIPIHFHYGSDGNVAFCMGVNLTNPDENTTYTVTDFSAAYGASVVENVSRIVQSGVLQFNSNHTSSTIPAQFRNLTYSEVQYATQLAIWKVLIDNNGPGNEAWHDGKGNYSTAWAYKNIYLPRMKNVPNSTKDIKGFYDYLLSAQGVQQPTASLQVGTGTVNGNLFQIPITVKTTDANAGTVVEFRDLPSGASLKRADGSAVTLYTTAGVSKASFSGDVNETMTLYIPTASNSSKVVRSAVYANTNATDSNLVWLTPAANNYQNLVKVEPTKVQSTQAQGRITLPKAPGQLELKKVDASNAALTLSGAVFGIYSDSACNNLLQKVTTGTNGSVTVTLDHGTYYVKELTAPQNYQLNSKVYTVNVSATKNTQTITNEINRYTIRLTKKDQDTKALLSGAVFGVYSNSACTTEVGRITTGADGTGTLGNLRYGTYWLKEITAPKDYVLQTHVYQVTTAGGHGSTVNVEATNVRKTNVFLIEKVEAGNTGIKLQGAEFGIYSDSACNNKVGSITTGANGIGTSPVLRYGTYYVKESKAPQGYNLNPAVYTVAVNDNSHTTTSKVVVTDVIKLYTLELYKTDVDFPDMKLSGAVFNVYSDAACTNRVGTFPATDANGYTKLENVRYGTYYIKEVTAPKDYLLSNQVHKVTTPEQNGAVIKIDATNKRKEGNLQIRKKDSTTGANLSGAIYYIYSDPACQNKVAEFPATDSNGYAKSPSLRYGVYYVKEFKAPTNFVINNQIYTVEVSDASPTTVYDVTNKPQLGTITVNKQGEVLVGYVNDTFVYENRNVSGAIFDIYAKEDIKDSNGAIIYRKDTIVDTVTTTDGTVTSKALPLGKYYVKEKQAVNGHYNDGTTTDVTLSYGGQTVEVVNTAINRNNPLQNASINLLKQDTDTKHPLQDATFAIYAKEDIKNVDGVVIVTKGILLEEVTTNGDGRATFTKDYPFGSYEVKEISTRPGYILNTEVWNVEFTYTNQDEQTRTFTKTFENTRMTAVIELTKVDKETGTAQADATLQGAIYGLYAREDILKPDGSGVMYAKGTKVAELTTDKDGKASMDNLYLGKYYVKEIKPSKGYLLDTTEYDIDATYTTSNTPTSNVAIINKQVEVQEQVIKRPIQIIKISYDVETTAPLLEGAGFSVYLKSTLVYKQDGTIDYDKSPKTVIGQNGETELFTDKLGHLLTIAIPYGEYVVSETTVPKDHKKAKDFEVTISEKDTEVNQDGISITNKQDPQDWKVIVNEKFTALLKLIKVDEETGKEVLMAGTEFKIFNLDENKYVVQHTIIDGKKVSIDTFTTNEEGYLITPEVLTTGKYRIEEVTAPDGYHNDGHTVEVEIGAGYVFEGNGTDDFWDEELQTYILPVKFTNPLVKGEIEVHKTGEVLTGVKEKEESNLFSNAIDSIVSFFTNKEKEEAETKYEFIYEEVPLKDAVYNIVVAEDIYSYDYQTDKNGNRIIYTDATGLPYKKGTVVDTITTDENGYAKSKLLPLGKYEIREVKAPYGFLDTELVHTAILKYKGQTVSVVGDSDGDAQNKFFNERIKPVPELPETPDVDAPNEPSTPENPDTPDVDDPNGPNTPENPDTPNNPNHPQNPSEPPVDEDGNPIIGIGVVKYERNEDGTTNYDKPLAGTTFGLYNRYDIKDVNGNVLIEKDTLLSTAVTGNDGMAIFEGDFPTNIYMEGSGVDITKPEESQYYAVELAVTDGYLLDQTPIDGLHFYYWDETMNQYVVVQKEQDNDYTKVEILKVSEVNGENQPLAGAVLSIYKWDSEKEEIKGEAIETWTSTLEPHRINALPFGEYVLVEEQAPEGYYLAEPIVFEVTETPDVLEIEMNDPMVMGEIEVHKTGEVLVGYDKEDGFIYEEQPLKDATYEIVLTEDVYYPNQVDSEQNPIIYIDDTGLVYKKGTVVDTITTDENGYATSKLLPLGKYEIREVDAPYGFLDTDLVHTAILKYEGQTVSVVGDSDGDAENKFFNKRIKPVPELPETPDVDDPNDPSTPENPDTPNTPNHPQNPSEPPVDEDGNPIIGIGMFKYEQNEDGTTNYDKPLAGTTFGLYNRYDITDVNGNVIVEKDTLLSTAVTGENGFAIFEGDFPTNIYMEGSGVDITKPEESQYYAVELAVTDGYLLDQTPIDGLHFYYWDSTMNEYVLVQKEQDNDYTKVEILKVSDIAGEQQPLPGAILSIYRWDSEKEEMVGEAIETWTSTLEPHRIDILPFGEYILVEEQTPEGYQKAVPIVFEVTDTPDVLEVVMEDPKTYGQVTIIKKEVDKNGNETKWYPVEGTKFKLQYADDFRGEDGFSVYQKGQTVCDENGEEIILTIGADGTTTSPVLPMYIYGLNGEMMKIPYEVVEIEATYGHTLMEEPFEVEFTYVDDETPLVETEVVVENPLQQGKIEIHKTGEQATDTEKVDETVSLKYEFLPLQNVEFSLYSDEDCTDLLEVLVTDETGVAVSSYYDVGTYFVKETKVQAGFVLDETIHKVEIKGDTTGNATVDNTVLEVENKASKVEIHIYKVGNVLTVNGTTSYHTPLKDVVFGIYNKEDITDKDGNVIVEKDTLLSKVVTDEDGMARYEAYLPSGSYYYQELQTVEGFVLDETTYDFTITLGNEEITAIDVNKTSPLVNKVAQGVLNIKKVDDKGTTLAGVEFTLTNDQTGQSYVVTTNEEGMATINNLPIGTYNDSKEWNYFSYTLRESKGLDGYEVYTDSKQIVFKQVKDGDSEVVVNVEVVNNKIVVPPSPTVPILGIEHNSTFLVAGIVIFLAFNALAVLVYKVRKSEKELGLDKVEHTSK